MRAESHGQPQEGQRDATSSHRGGLVTLLFTDLVGSTALKQNLGDHSGVALVREHHALVRDLLKQFPEGEEISTAGDSFFLVFIKPSDAVRFALSLQSLKGEEVEGAGSPEMFSGQFFPQTITGLMFSPGGDALAISPSHEAKPMRLWRTKSLAEIDAAENAHWRAR